jgi:hypothetical protein
MHFLRELEDNINDSRPELSIYGSVNMSTDASWKAGGLLTWIYNYICVTVELVYSVHKTL